MSKKLQQNLFDQLPKRGRKPLKPQGHFGGMYLKAYNPKSQRPMDTKKALHVVLHSSKATGAKSFKASAHEAPIWDIIDSHAKKTDVRIYEYANGGTHLHLLIRAKTREDYKVFIRTITGLIARLVGKSEKGKPLKEKFWDARPFSRPVSFGRREFNAAKSYLHRNNLEALGWMPYVPRNKRLPSEWRNLLTSTVISTA